MKGLDGQLITRTRLSAAFVDAGIAFGDTVCLHSAMGAVGHVCGGARTVIDAICDAVGLQGTVMMPAYTRDTADPREWRYPPAPPDWLDDLIAETPPYDPARSPTQNVGAVAELFRTYPGVVRSGHPISSVAAIGPNAAALVDDIPLDNRFGESSPFGRLVRLGGKVVMLGAPYETMSLLHLSQYRIGWCEPVIKSACMLVNNRREWVQFNDVRFPHDWASDCVTEMIEAGLATRRPCGNSYLVVADAGQVVDFTVQWRKRNDC